MFLPYDLREWGPAGHIVHFILDAVEQLPITDFRVNERGSGSEPYPPRMMLALLIYCYATGRFGSRTIEAASYSDVAVRYLCANHHPDLRPQKPHGRGVKPPTEPLPRSKDRAGGGEMRLRLVFPPASVPTWLFFRSHARLRVSPSQMAPAI